MENITETTQVELPQKEETPCECHCHKYNHGLPDGQSCTCQTNCRHCNPNWQEPVAASEPPKEEAPTVEVTKVEPEMPPLCGKCKKPKKDSPEATPENYCKCGRPLKWGSVDELQSLIDSYFAYCDPHWVEEEYIHELSDDNGKKNGKYEVRKHPVKTAQRPYTITGLAVFLETSRDVLLDYENVYEHDEFSYAIKRAKQRIHAYAENYLYEGKNQAASIFNLKNNWGWKDKTESEVDVKSGGEKLQPGVIVLPPK